MARISNYAKIRTSEEMPKIKLPQIANGEFEKATGQYIPLQREVYVPMLHNEKTFYRNSGNKHIKSRGL
jgi:hypothetical protein